MADRTGASSFESSFKTMFGIWSGPDALCGWRAARSFSMPSLLMTRSSIFDLQGPSQGIEFTSSVVKTPLNSFRRMSAFAFGSVMRSAPCSRGASPILSFFNDLIY